MISYLEELSNSEAMEEFDDPSAKYLNGKLFIERTILTKSTINRHGREKSQ